MRSGADCDCQLSYGRGFASRDAVRSPLATALMRLRIASILVQRGQVMAPFLDSNTSQLESNHGSINERNSRNRNTLPQCRMPKADPPETRVGRRSGTVSALRRIGRVAASAASVRATQRSPRLKCATRARPVGPFCRKGPGREFRKL
jgi:hypothetical protein